jgi:SHS2 domain-containing protein
MKVNLAMVKQAAGKSFKFIDHTADVGVIAYGAEIKQVFTNAALALFSLNRGNRNFEEEYLYDIVSRGQSFSALSMVRITLALNS